MSTRTVLYSSASSGLERHRTVQPAAQPGSHLTCNRDPGKRFTDDIEPLFPHPIPQDSPHSDKSFHQREQDLRESTFILAEMAPNAFHCAFRAVAVTFVAASVLLAPALSSSECDAPPPMPEVHEDSLVNQARPPRRPRFSTTDSSMVSKLL